MKPTIVKPFSEAEFSDLQNHIQQIRRIFDWPGSAYHDLNEPENNKFNRWYWHNLPLLVSLHNNPKILELVSNTVGMPVKPSYVFLSMYGPEGVCPLHQDRPQCQFTLDVLINGGEEWPIYIDDEPFALKPSEGVIYSGTGHKHYRNPMHEDSKAKFADLVFFHFVPTNWIGALS